MKMNRLIPMLPVRSMPASVDFYCGMLGLDVEKRNDDWGWAMLRFDECRLMVDQSIPRRWPGPAILDGRGTGAEPAAMKPRDVRRAERRNGFAAAPAPTAWRAAGRWLGAERRALFPALWCLVSLARAAEVQRTSDPFYAPEVVQAIHLEIKPEDLNRLHRALPKRIYVPATFR